MATGLSGFTKLAGGATGIVVIATRFPATSSLPAAEGGGLPTVSEADYL